MKFTAVAVAAALLAGATVAHAYDPKATIADLDARLAKIGAPSLQGHGHRRRQDRAGNPLRRTQDQQQLRRRRRRAQAAQRHRDRVRQGRRRVRAREHQAC
ncbi:MAG: hypothetical protein MZW92_54195 [Comamonadaceae bacterium]|nr:hypothetical protein [Comamonadaceae bacterium]